MSRPVVFSSGGGTQSTAIAAAIYRALLPKPDLFMIADTGREKRSTWEYLDAVTRPAMAEVGVEVHRIPHTYSTVDLYSKSGKRLLIPAFSSVNDGGKMSNFCSYEWKRRVCQRFVRERLPDTDVDVWLGFSTDELHRCTASKEQWWRHVFPLIEMLKMTRADCHALVRDTGWPEPPRSSCWMCPHMSDREWRELPADELAQAGRLERHVRKRDADVWLHRSMRPIASVDFDAQGDLVDHCKSGYCFT